MRMQQERTSVSGRMTSRPPIALRRLRGRPTGGGARELTGRGNLGALDSFREDAEGGLTLSVVHLMMMQMPTCITSQIVTSGTRCKQIFLSQLLQTSWYNVSKRRPHEIPVHAPYCSMSSPWFSAGLTCTPSKKVKMFSSLAKKWPATMTKSKSHASMPFLSAIARSKRCMAKP